MTHLLRDMMRIIHFLQKRFQIRNLSRQAKLDVLREKWNFIVYTLQQRNKEINKKDDFMNKMIEDLENVKDGVRESILEEYLRCCQRVHTIGFLQWRIMYPSSRCNIVQCEDLISERMWFLYDSLARQKLLKQMPNLARCSLPKKSQVLFRQCFQRS